MDVKGFTIDSPTTRDIDDSVWVESDSRGWTVTTCIANVAAAIAKDSTFDETAKRRAETLYHANGRTSPMIPRRFSEGSCSLFEGEARSVMAIRIRLDHMLEPQGLPRISEAQLKSIKRFSYSDITDILQDKESDLNKEVEAAARLSTMLMAKRRENGAFVLYDMIDGWVMSETGHVRRLKDVRETMGHIIVQELMILSNSELARFCLEKDIPVPFRNHVAKSSAPPRERMLELLEQGLSGAVKDIDRAQKSFMMVMNKASYSASVEGHYGLNLPAYLHGTSPIRRYPDLIAQRQILGHLNGRNLPYSHDEIEEICDHINGVVVRNAEKRAHAEIGKANERAHKAIGNGALSRLTAKKFERVVKVSTRGKFDRSVSQELVRRIENGTAALVDMVQVLLCSGEEWLEMRRTILLYLVRNPHHAPSVANLATQIGKWGEPKFLTRRGGEEHSLIHITSVRFEEPKLETQEVKAPSLKLSRQMAIVEAFAIHLGEPRPTWPDIRASSAQGVKKNRKTLDRNSTNPIGELMEYCQSKSLELPKYEFARSGGPDHNPEFTFSCKAAGVHVKSEPMTSKKLAKKEAASRAIQLLLERT